MSNYTIEVTENVVNLDVLKDHDVIIEIKSSDNFITFDAPSGYPILFTSGTLPASRVGSGYLIDNLTSGNTIVRTFGDQSISGSKIFSGDIISSGNLSFKFQPTLLTPSYFPVLVSDPSTFSRQVYTRTSSQIKSDFGLDNVQNIALSGVNFVAGSGLVGGGNLSTSRSFDVGQGDGLTVSADSIAVDSTVVRSTSLDQSISGIKTFSSNSGVRFTVSSGDAIYSNKKDIIIKGNIGSINNKTITVTPVSTIYTDRIYYLPEAGADADFVMTAGGQVITGPKTFTSSAIFNSGTFTSLRVGVNDVSVSGHTHTVSNITDFNTSVDSRITNANLQPSGNYSVSGHIHTISNITGLQTTLDNKQASGNYASSSHTHFSSNITDFNSSVSGLVNGIYAPLNSPSFSGVPLTPTAASGTNNTQIASTAFVRTEISNLVASAPTALDTLNELATALGNDANFSTTVTNNLAGKANLSGATFTGKISAPSGSFTSLSVSGIPLINGGYDYEIHVSQIDGDDTTGNGDLLNPVASITKALTLVGSQRKTIIVHPGTYTENPSITVQYTTITGPGLIGGNILLSGTLSTNTGCTIAGIKMTNLTITTPTGAGNVNILNCEISGTLTKSSNADYTVLRLCDYGAASITGAGLVAIFGGNPNFTTVNNAGANVIIKSAVTVAPFLTSGTLSLVDSVVVAAVTNAITSAASSVITLANCQMLISTLSNVAPIVLNGFYSIINCVYNKPSSTLATLSATGGSTNSIDYFQYINADKFITQGGTSSQYVKGDGSLALFPDNIVYTSGDQTISGVKTFSDLPFVNGTGISISGHAHTASNITNFNSSVSGLLPVGTANYLSKFGTNGSGLSNSLIFDNGTNVGIGTTSPTARLHVIGSGVFSSGIVVGDSSTNGYIYGPINPNTNNIRFNNGGADRIDFNSSNLFYNGVSYFQNNNYILRAGETTSTASQKDSYQLVFQNALWDGTTSQYATSNIRSIASTSQNLISRLAFSTHNSVNNTLVERMCVTSSGGYVGIGTTTPSSQLHVIGTGIFSSGIGVGINTPLDLIHVSGSSVNAQGIRLENADGYGGSIQADNGALYFKSPTNTAFRVQAAKIRLGDGSSATAIELTSNGSISQDGNGGGLTFSGTTAQFSNGMNVTNSGIFGSVGIGTATPSAQLQVVGTGIFSNGIYVSDLVNGTYINGNSSVMDFFVNNNRSMRISPYGTVAINRGTASALGALHVQGNGSNPANASDPIIVTSSAGAGSIIRFTDSASNDWQIGVNPHGSVVSGTGSGNFAVTRITSNSGVPYLTINSSGSIGIGTTAPQELLHVSGTISSSVGNLLRLNNSSATTNPSINFRIGGVGNFDSHFFISRNGTDVFGIDTQNKGVFLSSYSLYGNQQFFSYNNANAAIKLQNLTTNDLEISAVSGILFQSQLLTKMKMDKDGNFGIGLVAPSGKLGVAGGVTVGTNYNVTPPTNGMIVEGNVGIGTTTPRATLDASGVIRSTSYITSDTEFRLNNATFSRVATMDGAGAFAGGYNVYLSGSTPKHNSTGSLSSYYYSSDGSVRFYTNSSQSADTNASERMRITNSGYVGIGTTAPSSQLHVIGSGVISSGLIVNGNLTFDSFTESVVAIGNSSTSQTISLTSGTVQTCTLTGNCTFTMPTATAGKSFTLFLNSGAGNYTATFTGVRWADSATPTATITASKVDIYSFISDGTYWYGSFSQNYG